MTPSKNLHTSTRANIARVAAKQSVGSWELGQIIGQGRWTDVYRARPGGSPKNRPYDYAVKMLQSEHSHDKLALAMLQREAYAGRLVSHPCLISILAAHVCSPPFYLVTPLLPGNTLEQWLRESTLPDLPQVLWTIRQVAEALQGLHNEGWIHGDIKPSNIFLSPAGHTTLIDLGFAQKKDSVYEFDAFMSTPTYASPESFCSSHSVGTASDIYSLGITLYQLLTGNPPFTQTDPCQLAAAHLRQIPTAVRTIAPQVPPRVGWLVRRMLAKDPMRRPNIEELIALLVELEISSFDERVLETE